MKSIENRNAIDATVKIPGSKSLTHRALIAAGLANGKSRLKSFLSCEDTIYTAGTLQKLGIGIELDNDANNNKARCISTAESAVSVWVIPTNEELMIARHSWAVLSRQAAYVD